MTRTDEKRKRKMLSDLGLSETAVDAVWAYGFVDLLMKKDERFRESLRVMLDDFTDEVKAELEHVFLGVPGKLLQKRIKKPTPGSGTIADYEAYLAERPDDLNAWRVHADKLQEIGNPRGEYIAAYLELQKEVLRVGQRNALQNRLAELSKDMKVDGVMPCFFIEVLPDRYRLHNVHHQKDIWVVDWTCDYLDNEASKTQDHWIEWLQGKEWKLPDAYLYHAVARSVYAALDHDDPNQRTIAREFADLVFKGCTMTCTRIEYNPDPDGDDKIIHNHGYKGENTVELNIKGVSTYVESAQVDEEIFEALLDDDNKSSIIKMYNILSAERPFMWRFNWQELRSIQRRAYPVVFFPDLHARFLFLLSTNFFTWSAFGVSAKLAREFYRH
jgi:hypothetical protein